MKKVFILFSLILCFSSTIKAQVKTIYYLGDKVIQDSTIASTLATSYAIYGKLSNDSLYVYKKFDIQNNLMTTGSFKDENLTIPHGKFIFYSDVETFNDTYNSTFPFTDQNIFVAEEGEFKNGLTNGPWKTYYPDGSSFANVSFVEGLKQGDFISYNPKGKVEIFGTYINDKKEGEWLFKRGRKKIFYVNDSQQKKVNGKVKIN